MTIEATSPKFYSPQIYSPQEYLELEVNSEERHKYIKGEIFPLTGGTPNHNKKDDKFTAYRTISSFQEYLLIDQYRIYFEHYSKTEPHKWVFIEYDNPQEILSLSSLDFQIEIAEIYNKVNFDIEK